MTILAATGISYCGDSGGNGEGMAFLSIQVLGPFQVRLAGEHVTNFATDKVRALLVYLTLCHACL